MPRVFACGHSRNAFSEHRFIDPEEFARIAFSLNYEARGRIPLRVVAVARIGLLVVSGVAAVYSRSVAQSPGATAINIPKANESELIDTARAEAKQGVSLFYTQSYRSQGKTVRFTGSLYSGITDFKVNKCDLTVSTTIVDRYSGQIGDSRVNDTQSVYNNSVDLQLTPEIADSLHVSEGRPKQLPMGTNPTCSEKQGCTIDWVEFRAKRRVMKFKSMTNDVADYNGFVTIFDGMVDEFWIPISSHDAGKELISNLQSYAITCRQ